MSTITIHNNAPENIYCLGVNKGDGNIVHIDIETEYRSKIQIDLDIEQATRIFSILDSILDSILI